MSKPEIKTFVEFKREIYDADLIAHGWEVLGKRAYGDWHVAAYIRPASEDPKTNLWRLWERAGWGVGEFDTEELHAAIGEVCGWPAS